MTDESLVRGVRAWHSGDTAGALALFDAVRSRGGCSPELLYWRALCLLELGRRDAARRETDELRGQDPNGILGRVMRRRFDPAKPAASGSRGPGRVAFHMNQRFHFPIMEPLADLLSEAHPVLMTFHGQEVLDFRPDVVVICDQQGENVKKHLPETTVVKIGHGIVPGKNFRERGGLSGDVCCVASETVAAHLRDTCGVAADRLWVTGYVETDPLFRGGSLPLPVRLDPAKKTVLYAPTFNPGLSSVPKLGSRMADLIRGNRPDVQVLTRPHPLIVEADGAWMKWFRDCARSDADFHLVETFEQTIAPFMLAADLIVSDASNCPFQFLALNRPIVLIDARDPAVAGAAYDPASMEWTWRAIGKDVTDVAHLAAAVGEHLDAPGLLSDERSKYRDLLFGPLTDGRSADRIARRIDALLGRRAAETP